LSIYAGKQNFNNVNTEKDIATIEEENINENDINENNGILTAIVNEAGKEGIFFKNWNIKGKW